ncbi:hypothetical protein [Anaerosinus gibii]|uniref:Uncharacterized protein n=1 Tax=Selenobaculum gibii TaxID=3054208 RepID=A0A9Y2ESX8_9FIRM|nr:hypothetical protein [Selenobaculum gbiensis]WIW70891.1 hypothetical protein P3F81_00775 [Selenobaculum gbiensis]
MSDMERSKIEEIVRFTIDEYCDNWILWVVVLLLAFVLLMGNTFSFWLGVLVGLAIPYYIIPHYFPNKCETVAE